MVSSRGLVLLCHRRKNLQIGGRSQLPKSAGLLFEKTRWHAFAILATFPGQIGLIGQLNYKTYSRLL